MTILEKIYNTLFRRTEIKHQIHCVETKIMIFRDMEESEEINEKRLRIGVEPLKTIRELIKEQIKILDELENSILF